jgi:methionyl-tRNA synthetase
MSAPKRYTVTSALPYANGPLHVGHIAGAYLPGDIYVRYLRQRGRDVVYVCGSDEHGAAITIQAKKEGTTPQAIIDKYHEINKQAFKDLGIDFDIYHRTSSELHRETASNYFKDLYDKKVFEERETEQYYDEDFSQFLADRYIVGTCPNCGNDNAYGDQCEKCGTTLSPDELISPRSMLSNKPPVKRLTKHWYLPLNQSEEWLRSWIIKGEGRTEEWKTNVAGQCRSWIEQGLHPRSITRDLDWGVPVPLPGAEGKVLYVWLDAPIGYISATKQWALDNGKQWEPYWKDEETKLVHFIGKDNIVFHCIIFPVILKANDYILPTNVPANEFMNLEGRKLSTSRNWAVWVHEYLRDFPGQEDVLRYYLCSNMPETKDSEFTWADFQAKNNNELVATLGNFVNRVMVLTHKYFDGKVPATDALQSEGRVWQSILGQYTKVEDAIEAYEFKNAQAEMINLARFGNQYLTKEEPWKTIKTNPEAAAAVLFDCLQIINHIAIIGQPFLPFTSQKIRQQLNAAAVPVKWNAQYVQLPTGHALNQPELLFSKIEDETIQQQVDTLHASQPMTTPTEETQKSVILSNVILSGVEGGAEGPAYEPMKAEIVFDDFAKIDLRAGTILTAEKVEKADKLLKFTVDLGFEQRTIVSGVAMHFTPEQCVGQRVSIVANLAPRKLKGIESQGMILLAEDSAGKLYFTEPTAGAPNGAVIR